MSGEVKDSGDTAVLNFSLPVNFFSYGFWWYCLSYCILYCNHFPASEFVLLMQFLPKRVLKAGWASQKCKFQALAYDILPPATATTDYTIGLEKLSANRQFFIGAQMALSL